MHLNQLFCCNFRLKQNNLNIYIPHIKLKHIFIFRNCLVINYVLMLLIITQSNKKNINYFKKGKLVYLGFNISFY